MLEGTILNSFMDLFSQDWSARAFRTFGDMSMVDTLSGVVCQYRVTGHNVLRLPRPINAGNDRPVWVSSEPNLLGVCRQTLRRNKIVKNDI